MLPRRAKDDLRPDRVSLPVETVCMSEAHKLCRHFIDLQKVLIKFYQYPYTLCPVTPRQIPRSQAPTKIFSFVWPYEGLAAGACRDRNHPDEQWTPYPKSLGMGWGHDMCRVAQSCLTLCNPWTVARQVPLSMGLSRQECWSGLPLPTPGDLPDPGIDPTHHESPALAGGFFTTAPPGKALGEGCCIFYTHMHTPQKYP